MTLALKNKEKPKLIRFEEGRSIKDEILSRSRQRKTHSRTLAHHSTPATFNIIQTRLNLFTAAFGGRRVIRESPSHQNSTSSMPAFSFPVNINRTLEHFYFSILQPFNTSNFLKLTHSYEYNNRTFYRIRSSLVLDKLTQNT